MAIFTRFGTPCTVISGRFDERENLWIKVQMPGKLDVREYPAHELRADGGAAEIIDAVNAGNKREAENAAE